MENTTNEEQKNDKIHKSKLWMIGRLYFYIVGVNLLLAVGHKIFSKVINFEESIIVTALSLLVSIIAMIFAIKWAIKSILKESIVYPREVWKISLLVGITPLIITFLILIFFSLINPSKWSLFILLLLPSAIGMLISGLSYGIITYIWFKRLLNRF
jgi:hypothetical protein